MDTPHRLDLCAAELAEAARKFHAAAGRPGALAAAPDALASLDDALQALSGAWYQLAADASPGIVARRVGRGARAGRRPDIDELSREQEVRLMGALHDVAAAFARCARQCREARTAMGPLVASREAPARRVA